MSKLVTIDFVRIGIFDPYLNTLGGGEKYMMTAASVLSKSHDVSIFWDDAYILQAIHERFGIDISCLTTTQNIFDHKVSFISRFLASKHFDAIFYLSDGSIPYLATKKLFLHFQFPIQWVNTNTLFTRIKMGRVADVICNSLFTKEFIDKSFRIDSKVVYPPASGEYLLYKGKKENYILSVGRFAKMQHGTFKKQEIMIDAFKKIVDKGLKNWKLVLVVSFRPEDRQNVEQLQETVGKYPIEINTNVSSDQLNILYGQAKIYWHAAGFGEDLQMHPELAEHFGIATVQAMEQGTVPVVFDGGGQKEIITNEENGLLWQTIDEMIHKTNELITNKIFWNKLSKAAEQRALNYTGDQFAQKIMLIIQ